MLHFFTSPVIKVTATFVLFSAIHFAALYIIEKGRADFFCPGLQML
jgi:hypothetical protein